MQFLPLFISSVSCFNRNKWMLTPQNPKLFLWYCYDYRKILQYCGIPFWTATNGWELASKHEDNSMIYSPHMKPLVEIQWCCQDGGWWDQYTLEFSRIFCQHMQIHHSHRWVSATGPCFMARNRMSLGIIQGLRWLLCGRLGCTYDKHKTINRTFQLIGRFFVNKYYNILHPNLFMGVMTPWINYTVFYQLYPVVLIKSLCLMLKFEIMVNHVYSCNPYFWWYVFSCVVSFNRLA